MVTGALTGGQMATPLVPPTHLTPGGCWGQAQSPGAASWDGGSSSGWTQPLARRQSAPLPACPPTATSPQYGSSGPGLVRESCGDMLDQGEKGGGEGGMGGSRSGRARANPDWEERAGRDTGLEGWVTEGRGACSEELGTVDDSLRYRRASEEEEAGQAAVYQSLRSARGLDEQSADDESLGHHGRKRSEALSLHRRTQPGGNGGGRLSRTGGSSTVGKTGSEWHRMGQAGTDRVTPSRDRASLSTHTAGDKPVNKLVILRVTGSPQGAQPDSDASLLADAEQDTGSFLVDQARGQLYHMVCLSQSPKSPPAAYTCGPPAPQLASLRFPEPLDPRREVRPPPLSLNRNP